MFNGVGGFRLGLERSGWKCVWANDNDKYANKVYKKKFGSQELAEGDIREVKADKVPDHTLLTAGFPCQAFSVAGKRKALKESRGTLFTHILRVAAHKRPPLLLLENVKGLLSSDSGRTFAIILRALGNLGYLLEWQVLNSKHFGVPQNRERVFLVGHLGGEGGRQIFPIGECDCLPNQTNRGQQEIEEGVWSGDLCSTLDARYGALRNAGETYIANTVEASYSKQKSLTNTILLDNFGGNIKQRIQKAEVAWTLGGSKTGIMDSMKIRKLTPIECERLQGFPDGWTIGLSDTQRYRLLGNAVTVNVIEFLGYKLKE